MVCTVVQAIWRISNIFKWAKYVENGASNMGRGSYDDPWYNGHGSFWQCLRYWWDEVKFWSTTITFDRVYPHAGSEDLELTQPYKLHVIWFCLHANKLTKFDKKAKGMKVDSGSTEPPSIFGEHIAVTVPCLCIFCIVMLCGLSHEFVHCIATWQTGWKPWYYVQKNE